MNNTPVPPTITPDGFFSEIKCSDLHALGTVFADSVDVSGDTPSIFGDVTVVSLTDGTATLEGGVLSGLLVPVNSNDATNKLYVDNAVSGVITGLTTNGMLYATSASTIGSTSAGINGQLLIGSTGAAPVLAALSGTTNQVIVTNRAGSITLSTPQSINTTSTPTFAGINTTSNIQCGGNLAQQGSVQLNNSTNYNITALDVARGFLIRTSGGGGTDLLPSVAGLVTEFGITSFSPSKAIYFRLLNKTGAGITLTPGSGFSSFLMTTYSISAVIPSGNSAVIYLEIDTANSGFWAIVQNNVLP